MRCSRWARRRQNCFFVEDRVTEFRKFVFVRREILRRQSRRENGE